MSKKSERELIDEVKDRLVAKFAEMPEGRVSIAVEDAYADFADSLIRDFIPLLVERRAGDELRLDSSSELAYS
ncbi:hypothetical protein AU195_10355 [Mycobacterium sp. IS-1496]|uniref:three-helix bundle dimerization domain-containing protein n=1 Tax=Mycobacterium sp. IS-1496 TaxID=1772284 RepID=UPI000741791C|nr:hypothetical protein [Mycobacterium sp. IS-1496]KUI35274.1 hypothetical protein AU195_10355 [Mycobacterium sp. IS-1496]